ncbi:MAG TPA: ABC transporter substrate-binding protein [Methanospirillum sp.]|uniref:ABC transporter substrate-binding protein n=1 Tax=Methanospirillum sp. TaxID=45200 RepID=UPI002C164D79|nr:ABC transporter substrate-binding protein [Methanospirillum sp.]HWQ63630.1 ABC transporter substrate-binding protein [Methanospirillum sp.]
MNRWRYLLVLLVLLCLSGQIGLADQNGTVNPDVFKIGAIYNLNGSQANLDIPSSQGALTAARLINKKGGIDGVKVDVIMRDGASDPETIRKVAEDLISNESVPVLIGLSDTDMVLPAAQVAAAHHVPFITSGATSPKLPEQVPDYLYLACFGDNAQGSLAAEYAYKNLSYHSCIVVYDTDMQYTTLLAQYFSERYKELGGTIVSQVPIHPKTNVSDVFSNLSSGNQPDFYYIAVGPEDAPGVIRAAHGQNTVPIIGGDSFDTKNLSNAVLDTDGDVYYTTHAYFGGENISSEIQNFKTDYTSEYGTEPTPFAGLGYDAVMIAVRAAGNNDLGTDLREGINQIHDYSGVTGTISYENGTTIPKKSVHLIYTDGLSLTQVDNNVPEKVPNP